MNLLFNYILAFIIQYVQAGTSKGTLYFKHKQLYFIGTEANPHTMMVIQRMTYKNLMNSNKS